MRSSVLWDQDTTQMQMSAVGSYTPKTSVALRKVGPGDFPLSDGPVVKVCEGTVCPLLSQQALLWASAHRREWKVHKFLIIYNTSWTKSAFQGKTSPRITMVNANLIGFWKPLCAQVDIFPSVRAQISKMKRGHIYFCYYNVRHINTSRNHALFFFSLEIDLLDMEWNTQWESNHSLSSFSSWNIVFSCYMFSMSPCFFLP